ncbi:GDSL-like Lipase/Acylhydrolase [Pigmentiphaga humi]|uniref:GDSL-like Lipase/Acylhydrolase n=1 Tax=Pigmentiphaga humi TaxID=2478468 RepID=A0A3P4B8X0_9BURK|nr:SGNH/GDSL hydrolase family protein [Pigmentiphaga humi]VCU72158.1 GDSL-like Lipase/Acylhydrolase [Pigmentiphaga humi]
MVFRPVFAAALFALCSAGMQPLAAQEVALHTPAGVPAADTQWTASFEAFERADRLHAPAPGGVLFVGSSSIRLWSDLETRFTKLPVLKRGFGGSRMIDCARHVSRLVIPYRPRVVLVYAGDNDLAEGRSPEDILASFTVFVESVRRALPDTRVAYISIKPSPSRAALIPQVRATNALIRAYTTTVANADYIDVFTPMLAADGQPRPELFREDALHLNDTGYALWASVIAAHIN